MGGRSSDPNKAAMRAQREQMARLDQIDLPTLREYQLTAPELVGLLEAEQVGDTELGDIELDPRLAQVQQDTLQDLLAESEEGMSARSSAHAGSFLSSMKGCRSPRCV